MAKVIIGINDLSTTHPYLVAEWDYENNGDKTPYNVSQGSTYKSYWKCPDYSHEYSAPVNRRTQGKGCPVCSGNQIMIGFNDLATTHPHLISEWDEEKNGDKTPFNVSQGANYKAHWKCVDYSHEYKVKVNRRSKGSSCLICSGNQIMMGFNDLATTHPKVSREWDYSKNGGNTPFNVTKGSVYLAHWKCSAYGHEYPAKINQRTNGSECPICSGLKVLVGFNDLATTHPHLVSEWDEDKNQERTPFNVNRGSNYKAQWKCPDYSHEYSAPVNRRTQGNGCPICSGMRILIGFNDLATINPILASEWDHNKNGENSPYGVTKGSDYKAHWKCPGYGHEYIAMVRNRNKGTTCPICSGVSVLVGFNDLATTHPHLVPEWDDEKNGDKTPYNVSHGSNYKAHWKCPEYSHEYVTMIGKRKNGSRCSICAGKKILIGFNDLATTHPHLVPEWDDEKNGDKTPYNVSHGSEYKAYWKCPRSEHGYLSTVNHRTNGTNCPQCVTYKNESEFRQMFTDVTNFTFANGHIEGERDRFEGNRIQVDMIDSVHKVIIEYDGYWSHGENKLHKKTWEERKLNDISTTETIIREGYKIIRIRETPLKFLPMKDPNLFQVHFKDKEDKLPIVEKCVKALQNMGVNIRMENKSSES